MSDMIKGLDAFLGTPVSLAHMEMLLVDLPQKEVFRSGIGIRKSREALILKWTDRDGAFGYGECSARPDPYYSGEFIDGSWQLVKDFAVPLIKSATTYGEVLQALGKIRGWNFTKAAVELAMNDLLTRKNGTGILDCWTGERTGQVPIGVSMGIYPDYQSLKTASGKNLAQGYKRLKFKISPQVDPDWFKQLQEELPNAYISFDANGTFHEKDFPVLKAFASLGAMIEQPFPPGRVDIFQKMVQEIPDLKICLDEEVEHVGHLASTQQLGMLTELNIKPGRVGGPYQSLLVADHCAAHGIPCWVGGMFETGIGRTFNLRFASLFPSAQAHDQSPSSRYFLEDIVTHPIDMDSDGFARDFPVTNDLNKEIVEKYLVRRETLS